MQAVTQSAESTADGRHTTQQPALLPLQLQAPVADDLNDQTWLALTKVEEAPSPATSRKLR